MFILQRRLRKAGVINPLLVFRDGAELVDYLGKLPAEDSSKPCVLLLDLKMPMLDGFDVLAWLRACPGFQSLPVAVISSSSREEDRNRAIKDGASEYFEKFPTESDLARVMSWASGSPFSAREK